MKTLVLCNHKGGVGKSAVATLLTHYLVHLGRRVLAVDFDHQGNFSSPLSVSKRPVTAAFTSDATLSAQTWAVPDAPFVLVAAGDELLRLERQGTRHNEFANNFRRFLREVDGRFDVCVIDMHPSPDIRMLSALASADFALSPIQLTQESVDGVMSLVAHPRVGVLKVKEILNPKLHFIGLLPTMVEHTPLQKENMREIMTRYGKLLIRTRPELGYFARLPRRSAIAEAQGEGLLLWEMKKTAARQTWQEIKPTLDHIVGIVLSEEVRHAA